MKKNKELSVLSLLKLLSKKQITLFIFATIFALIGCGTKLFVPVLIGLDIDNIFKGNGFTLFDFGLLFGFISVGMIASYVFHLLLTNATQSFIKDLRDLAFRKINKCKVSYLDQTYKGDVIAKVTNDCENIAVGIQNGFSIYMEGIFTVLFTIGFMFYINWIMALVVIFLTNFSILVTYFLGKRGSKFFKEKAKNNGELQAFSLEIINNFDLDRSYSLKKFNVENFVEKSKKVCESSIKSGWIAALVNPETRLVTNIIYALVILCGTVLAINPFTWSIAFTIGNLTSFLAYTNQYMKPFNEMSQVTGDISFALASSRRLLSLFNISDDLDESTNELKDEISEINVKDLSFSYDKNKEILKKINFNIKKGEKLAIVGPTGCGKTTIINLLMRFYDLDSGEISYNNNSYKDLTKKSIRNKMTMVLQDTWIFNGTIKDNIRYGNEEKSDEEILKASKLSTADDFISRLPDGYNTVVNATSGLSSGEMQLICITRMLLNDPEFIILDEATSNVDTRTELRIVNAMNKLMEGKTSIIIAHRLSTIKQADKILVINNGEIIESGTHSSLINQKGFYYSLYNSQFE